MKQQTITAVVLSRNDESNIKECLQNLVWCNEILLIDDYSTDETPLFAKKFGAFVYKRHLNDDFAAQRNFALKQAKGDWILFVDSDEMVSSELQKEIQETLHNNINNGFYIPRTDYMFGKELKYGETACVKLIRLARKNAGIWKRAVHEVWDIPKPTETLVNPLVHYSHPTIAEFLIDINNYSTRNAKVFYHEGVRASFISILLYPVAKLFQNLILRQGIYDGMPGIIIALMMSFHSFLTRAKLYMLTHD